MNSIETIREFLGWCAVINSGLLVLSSIILIVVGGTLARIHAKIKYISRAYFQFLAQYKIAIIVLNIVPYFVLKIMG